METIDKKLKIEKMVRAFYQKVNQDEVLAPKFLHVNWDTHLPIMFDFWNMMILGDQSYKGNPFSKHMNLDLQPVHFHQWITLFHQTVDEFFDEAQAVEIKVRATHIANVWQFKLGLPTS